MLKPKCPPMYYTKWVWTLTFKNSSELEKQFYSYKKLMQYLKKTIISNFHSYSDYSWTNFIFNYTVSLCRSILPTKEAKMIALLTNRTYTPSSVYTEVKDGKLHTHGFNGNTYMIPQTFINEIEEYHKHGEILSQHKDSNLRLPR